LHRALVCDDTLRLNKNTTKVVALAWRFAVSQARGLERSAQN
jgi:hypothetical protein